MPAPVLLALLAGACQTGPSPVSSRPVALHAFGPAVTQDLGDASPDERAPVEGYGHEGRVVGGPTDVDTDLALSFPKSDSLFGGSIPDGYFKWKEDFFEDTGVKLAFSYQSLYQHASDTRSLGQDTAWGGWLLLEGKWEAINNGEDYEGSLTFDLDWRHTFGDHATPAVFGALDVGSLWPTDAPYFEWDPSFALLYWEQWFEKDVFNLRAGKQLASATYDFFRFKDGRTSFTASPFTAHTSIPAPAFGQAVSFKWWPEKESSFYVHGTLNDMNGEPGRSSAWTPSSTERQYFYGLELGYFWRRGPRDFDHVHLDLFYADEKDTQAAGLSERGRGRRQAARLEAVGGPGRVRELHLQHRRGRWPGPHLRRAHGHGWPGAKLKPFDVRGEIGVGTAWMEPINSVVNDQYGGEVYWKVLVIPRSLGHARRAAHRRPGPEPRRELGHHRAAQAPALPLILYLLAFLESLR